MKKTEKAPADKSSVAPVAPPPTRPPKKTEMSLRVEFTRDEIVDLARKQAEAYGELNRAEEDRKAVTAQLKAKCDGISARISEFAGKITAGFEYRIVPCEVRYDDPKPGLKTAVRLDTGDAVSVDPMSLAERQAELDLDKKAEAPKAEVLTIDMFDDLSEAQVMVGEDAEVMSDLFTGWLRDLFVTVEDEIASDEYRRTVAANLCNENSADDLEKFIAWLRADRPSGNELPGGATALALIEHARSELTKIATKKRSSERVATRRADAGTVSVGADEGSRDDAGPDSKNDL